MEKTSIEKMLELLKLAVDCEQTEKIVITLKPNKKSSKSNTDSK